MDSIIQQSYNRHKNRAFRTLLGLYEGNYRNLFLSLVFYVIKNTPAWATPIAIANVINAATGGGADAERTIYLNVGVMLVLVLQNGVDMAELDLRSFRKHLAVVPQNTILFDGSIRDNITYGLESVSQEQLEEVLHAANLWKVIQNLPEGLDTMIGEHGDKLSGGQRQRLSIAHALIRNPKVILLDEATSALDSVSERRIKEALANLSRGRTTFIVAHRLSTIRDADKIAVIEQGRCVEFGTFEELMAQKGTFYEMQALQ